MVNNLLYCVFFLLENDSIDSEENNISKIQKQKSLDNPDVVMQGNFLKVFYNF